MEIEKKASVEGDRLVLCPEANNTSVPFDIGRFMLLPRRKLCGFFVKTRAERGAFRRILHVIAKHNARLKQAHFLSISQEKVKTITIFLDYTDCTVPPEKLSQEIAKAKSVLSVTAIKPKIEGFIADTLSSPLLMGGARAVILRSPGYKGLIKGIRERFGSAGEAFLYYNGFEIGVEYGKAHREAAGKLGITDPKQIFSEITVSMFNCVGFGIAEIDKLTAEPPYGLGKVYNSFECELGRGAKEPYSQLIRGIIAGVLTELFNTKMTAKEKRCIAKGDPYCEFEAKPEIS